MRDQFLHEYKCFPCEKDNCTENENDGCKCKKCKDGFYNFDYQCKSCIENCKDCTNSTKCIKCKEKKINVIVKLVMMVSLWIIMRYAKHVKVHVKHV